MGRTRKQTDKARLSVRIPFGYHCYIAADFCRTPHLLYIVVVRSLPASAFINLVADFTLLQVSNWNLICLDLPLFFVSQVWSGSLLSHHLFMLPKPLADSGLKFLHHSPSPSRQGGGGEGLLKCSGLF